MWFEIGKILVIKTNLLAIFAWKLPRGRDLEASSRRWMAAKSCCCCAKKIFRPLCSALGVVGYFAKRQQKWFSFLIPFVVFARLTYRSKHYQSFYVYWRYSYSNCFLNSGCLSVYGQDDLRQRLDPKKFNDL